MKGRTSQIKFTYLKIDIGHVRGQKDVPLDLECEEMTKAPFQN